VTTLDRVVGAGVPRVDGPQKVRGTAPYAYEQDPGEPICHVAVVQSTVNRGRITRLDPTRAEARTGVLAVLTPANAPRLSGDLASDLPVLQSLDVHYQGQIVAAVVAESSEIAKAAVGEVVVEYAAEPPDVALSADRPDLYAPEQLNAGFDTDSVMGDVDGALTAAPVSIDVTYETPTQHNNPIEMHVSMARWDGDSLTLWDADQGPHNIVDDLVEAFGLEAGQVRVISPYVGGAFGSKAFTHPHQVLAAMAARVVGRPVVLELTRQQMFSLVGHRPRTIQTITLGADAAGKQELDPGILGRADRVVVDRRSQCERLGELRSALAAGTVPPDRPIDELGEIVAGSKPGRRSASEITVCDLTGTGVQDTAIAIHAVRATAV
jgi:xanthine dehydrogenase YagR molybdenum-binding subunit